MKIMNEENAINKEKNRFDERPWRGGIVIRT